MEPAAGDRANKQSVNFAELVAEALLSTRSDAIVATESDGIIRFWNPGAERVFGRSRRNVVGRSLDLIPSDCGSGIGKALPMSCSRDRVAIAEVTCSRSRPCATMTRRFLCSFTIAPLGKAGQTVGMAAIIRDMTKQFKETRALKRALSSHEPLPAEVLEKPATRK